MVGAAAGPDAAEAVLRWRLAGESGAGTPAYAEPVFLARKRVSPHAAVDNDGFTQSQIRARYIISGEHVTR